MKKGWIISAPSALGGKMFYSKTELGFRNYTLDKKKAKVFRTKAEAKREAKEKDSIERCVEI